MCLPVAWALRSSRHGVAAPATNMDIPDRLIQAVNRLRSEHNQDLPALDMTLVYARLDHINPTVLRYSNGL